VLAGFDHIRPISIDQSGSNLRGRWSAILRCARGDVQDMGLPWDPEVKNAIKAQGKVFESLGCIVEEGEPDFYGTRMSVFGVAALVDRAGIWRFAGGTWGPVE